jgi:hypothetical protein
VCVLLEFELRAYALIHTTSPFFVFVMYFFFHIGSPELFALADFELQSS